MYLCNQNMQVLYTYKYDLFIKCIISCIVKLNISIQNIYKYRQVHCIIIKIKKYINIILKTVHTFIGAILVLTCHPLNYIRFIQIYFVFDKACISHTVIANWLQTICFQYTKNYFKFMFINNDVDTSQCIYFQNFLMDQIQLLFY